MNIKNTVLKSCLLLSVCVSINVHATNGIYLNGYGAKSAAMGGIGIAAPIDAIVATHVNPAGTAFTSDRIDGGILFLNPQRRAVCCDSINSGGEVSQKALFVIPNIGITYKANDTISYSAGMVGLGGGRTQYQKNFFNSADTGYLGIKLEIGEINGTVSYKYEENQAVAISPVIVAMRFAARGLDPFINFSVPADEDKVTNNGHDWSFGGGLRFGWQGNFMNDQITLGAVYTTKMYTQKFDKYAGLFANHGEFDLPVNYGLGISYKPTEDWMVSFDWQRVLYSDLKSVGNPALPISALDGDPRNLGEPGGPGFGWRDVNIFKLGASYVMDDKTTLMAGINFGRSPIPDANGGGELEFNVLAPATTELHISAGATYKLNSVSELTVSGWHAFRNKQSQYVPVGTGLPFEDQNIEIEMRQYAIEVGYAYHY